MVAPLLMRAAAGVGGAIAGYQGAKKLDESTRKPAPAPAPAASVKVTPPPAPAPAPAPAESKSSRRKEFEQEFAAARKRGEMEFSFYGKPYSTRMDGESKTAHADKMKYNEMIRSAERAKNIKS